jgi:3-oxoacyl-[acyl-carrier-protein] synthase-1/3-oxoacyl-[acyl-carrier-protein] synthase II
MEAAGVVLGTTAGSALHFIESYAAFKAGLSSGCSDRDDYFAANLALALPIPAKGPRLTVTDACTSGADALGLGMDLIRHGECPCVICGGADALSLVPHTGFARLMIYDDRPCRPFDLRRKGLNLGEGGAVFVLESMEHAGQRGADIIGYLLGYGAGADAYHLTAPHPQGRGLASALREALAEAALDARDMAFVNAHGTGTPDNDKVEGRTLASMLPGVPVWAGKGCTGHTLGAAGALEALLSLVALTQGIVPCSPGFEQPDPETMIRPTTEEAPTRTPFALSTSLGFGGGNAALLLGAVPGREGA